MTWITVARFNCGGHICIKSGATIHTVEEATVGVRSCNHTVIGRPGSLTQPLARILPRTLSLSIALRIMTYPAPVADCPHHDGPRTGYMDGIP